MLVTEDLRYLVLLTAQSSYARHPVRRRTYALNRPILLKTRNRMRRNFLIVPASLRKQWSQELLEKFQARRRTAPSLTWGTMRCSVARDQAPSNKRSDDSQNELSIATHPRENLGSLQFGVFQQNRPEADLGA